MVEELRLAESEAVELAKWILLLRYVPGLV
jgi:hypothetical protein